MILSNKKKGIALAIIASVSFGLEPMFSKILLDDCWDASNLLLMEGMVSAAVVLLALIINGKSVEVDSKTITTMTLSGLIYACMFFF